VLHPNTVRAWIAAAEGGKKTRLFAGALSWNRIYDAVRWAVQEIRASARNPNLEPVPLPDTWCGLASPSGALQFSEFSGKLGTSHLRHTSTPRWPLRWAKNLITYWLQKVPSGSCSSRVCTDSPALSISMAQVMYSTTLSRTASSTSNRRCLPIWRSR